MRAAWDADGTGVMDTDDEVFRVTMRVTKGGVLREAQSVVEADGDDYWKWSVWGGGEHSCGTTMLGRPEAERRACLAAEVILHAIGQVL